MPLVASMGMFLHFEYLPNSQILHILIFNEFSRKGILRWDDGDVFEGEFEDDEKVRGTFKWKGGDVYTGEFKDSLMHGQYVATHLQCLCGC